MTITTERIGIFFGLVFGLPILAIILGCIFSWLIAEHKDILKKFKKAIEVLFYLVIYLGLCALLAFGIGGK